MRYDDLFTYNPCTGELRWKERSIEMFNGNQRVCRSWNKRMAGKMVGSDRIHETGKRAGHKTYRVAMLDLMPQYVHRIAWVMSNGPIDKGMVIDHIDGDPWNNRLSNLRLVTSHENAVNKGKQANNTSGHPGVYYAKKFGTWEARVWVRGKEIFLGRKKTLSEAIELRRAAEVEHYGEYRRTA